MSEVRQSPRISSLAGASVGELLRIQARVIGAVLLRDMGTRFGSTPLSYIVAILWPAAHVAILLIIYSVLGRQPSFGTDLVIWVVTGALPFVTFVYPFRMVSIAIDTGRPLMSFPIVRSIDLIIARVLLEFLTAGMYAAIVYGTLSILGWKIEIFHAETALVGLMLAFLLGTSMAIFMIPIVMLIPRAAVVGNLVTILMWITSGILFLPDSAPEPIRTYLSYNPLLHAIELFRTGIYFDYRSDTLDLYYLLRVSISFLALGLIGERAVRLIRGSA